MTNIFRDKFQPLGKIMKAAQPVRSLPAIRHEVSASPSGPASQPSLPKPLGAGNSGSGSPAPAVPGLPGNNPTGSGIIEAGKGTVDGINLSKGIKALDSKGDTATMRITPEAKVQGNVRFAKVGLKAQMGSTISVTRNSDAPDSTYTLRLEKHELGALTGEVGTDTLGKGKAGGKSALPGGNLKLEAGIQGYDAVEMTFDSPEDAARAAEILQDVQKAEMIDDGLGAVLPGPLGKLDDIISGRGKNPLANPLTEDGKPGWIANKIAGVDQSDLDFLNDNISAYETTVGTRGRGALELKGKLGPLDLAAEGRMDDNRRLTRRVELPTDDKDGSVTFTLSGGARLSAKERANYKISGFQNGLLTAKADNRLELANAQMKISAGYTIPKGTDVSTTSAGRPVPEKDMLAGDFPVDLDKISVETTTEWRDQSITDVSRGDSQILTQRLDVTNPEKVGTAVDELLNGNFKEAARVSGTSLTIEAKDVNRSGVDVQPGVKIDLGIGDIEGSVILSSGVDDVVGTRSLTIAAPAATPPKDGIKGPQPDQPDDTNPTTTLPPAPADDGQTYVVTPYRGVNVRDAQGNPIAVIQSGSFVRDGGERQTDTEGYEWMKVSGTDQQDAPVDGWVRSDLLEQHDSATGAMDEQGRINPTAEYNRMDQVTVRKDDNLWNIAQEHGWDYEATLEANKDHLRNPSLIFEGDTIYVPGSARGPEPVETTPQDAQPPQKADGKQADDTPSVTTESTGDPQPQVPGTGSGSGSASGSPWGPLAGGPFGAPSGGRPYGLSPGSSAEGLSKSRGRPLATTDTPPATNGTANPNDMPNRPGLDDILKDYQVEADDQTTTWKPKVLQGGKGFIINLGVDTLGPLTGKKDEIENALGQLTRSDMPQTEADVLDRLSDGDQLKWALTTKQTMDEAPGAYDKPAGYTGSNDAWANDGHVDAYRHAIWNARMTRDHGEDWTREYATAHEKVDGNPGPREAMDLHNNEVGRRIASENPNATDAELQQLVKDAVDNGEMVVIDKNGNLAWSDQVALGEHKYLDPDTPLTELEGNPEIDADPQRANTSS